MTRETVDTPPNNPAPRLVLDEGGQARTLPVVRMDADFVVVGGGVAGTCAAITAARAGLRVVLVQDRPVLGGNASSEVRLWVLGATAHMGNNNRWAREGGVLEEIIVENLYRNREGNPAFFDALLLEKVWAESNITLLLNTAADGVEMTAPDKIDRVLAYGSQNQTRYEIAAPLFADMSGDGILGFLAGAAFRVGAESGDHFDEPFIPPDDYGHLLGHSLYFYSRDVGRPVKYVPPAFAHRDIQKMIPRIGDLRRDMSGCPLWWLEWGDNLDRIFDSERIKEELWRVVYGVWDYIKNSGAFPDVENLTLDWVGTIPGKRESRRFEGDYILRQQDITGQRPFDDAIAYGGWATDLHPAKGVYSPYPGCTQYHSKGLYTIPYRCIYSRNVANLFLGGRLTSVSHIAFGSTRVISTGTLCGQAAALAAALCKEHHLLPREVGARGHLPELQRRLTRTGQYIPHVHPDDPDDLVAQATLTPSATLELAVLPPAPDAWRPLGEDGAGMLLPLSADGVPTFTFIVRSAQAATLEAELWTSSRPGNFTPDRLTARASVALMEGFGGDAGADVTVDFGAALDEAQYAFVMLRPDPSIQVRLSDVRLTGVLSVFGRRTQPKNEAYGFDEILFFRPERRPKGKNLALRIDPPLSGFGVEQLRRACYRPASGAANAWLAPWAGEEATLRVGWDAARTIGRVVLWFDTDFDHPMESCLMGHPEDVVPFCVQRFRLLDDRGEEAFATTDNHHSRVEIRFDPPRATSALTLHLTPPLPQVPCALFGIQAFA